MATNVEWFHMENELLKLLYFTFKLNIDLQLADGVSTKSCYHCCALVNKCIYRLSMQEIVIEKENERFFKITQFSLLECNEFGRKHVFDMSRQVFFFFFLSFSFSAEMVLNLITHAYTRRSIYKTWMKLRPLPISLTTHHQCSV